MPDEKAAFDIFLSHNSKDKPAVRQIADALEERGIRAWLDERELIPGRPWIPELERIIGIAPAVAVFVGENGIGPWEQPEIEGALIKAVKRGIPVIPVLLPNSPADTELPLFLQRYTFVNLSQGLSHAGLDSLELGITGRKPTGKKLPARLVPPRLHNLPFSSLGDLLKGRDEELRKLQDGAATAITQAETIYGLGGIGKTRLAVEHAWRSGNLYEYAFFVVAESPEALHSGLANLARPDLLKLPEYKTGVQEESFAAVLRWLREHDRWLLILDNVDTKEAEQAVVKIVPALSSGRVLITSRLRDWPAEITKQQIETLNLDEAQKFVLERTVKDRTLSDDDKDLAFRLAEDLGGLPLALEQAAAYIVQRQMSFSKYLKAWEKERERVLKWYDPSVMQYPSSVAVTWQKTFEQLRPTAATILRLSAYLAPDPISIMMFEDESKLVEEAVSLFCAEMGVQFENHPVEEAIVELASFSMVTRKENSFTVHRIVQDVMRFRVPEDQRQSWIKQVMKIIWLFAPQDVADIKTWATWDLLSSHARHALEYVEHDDTGNSTMNLMNHLAVFLKIRGLFEEAEPLMRRALEIHESMGTATIGLAAALNNLAKLLLATGRQTEAEQLMKRSLDVILKVRGANHSRIAEILVNLADLLVVTDRPLEAEPIIQRALKIYRRSRKPQQPGLASGLGVLAQVFMQTHRRIEAEPLLRTSLEMFEKYYVHDHPEVALRLFNLGEFLIIMGRLGEAEPLLRRALNIFEETYGPGHPDTKIARKAFARLQWEIAFTKAEGSPQKNLPDITRH